MALDTRYNPSLVEDKWYQVWRERGYFQPNGNRSARSFVIVMPPPNVTGVLHLGHALNGTWQDILIRYHRMRGDNTLWIPGTDHAGIHTQMKVDELLRQQNIDRREMGRDAFIERVWEWKETYGGEILRQFAKIGASVDWDRLRFTLDDGLSRAVNEVFVRLYEEGLLYRGNYITNWCVTCRTALSDIEVQHQEESGTLTFIKYPVVDSHESIIVATTRPETLLGDTAIAVNPQDKRWQHLVGKAATLPLTGRTIPIIADDYVDREYGTGAVKVTPAHDPNDFEIGERHGLLKLKVIDESGMMVGDVGSYQGLNRFEARKHIVQDLETQGFVDHVEDISHAVGHCEKCSDIIEPLLSLQWFVRIKPLAEPAIAAVKQGDIHFIPERFEKIYMNWMENIHDWCISRQIWWGHRIPAYYCDSCSEVVVSQTRPDACPACQGSMRQDEDVLDTWFSSALWPFSTLGWPDQTEDLAMYYPTSVLSTGYDIIFYWVSRMIMQGLHFTGDKPFDTVLLHGLVRDSQGRKMSKSLGNGVNPLEVIEKYGADAMRMALVLGSAPGNDYRWSWERFESGSHFSNKIYNAMRFVLMNLEDDHGKELVQAPLSPYSMDLWIWSRLNETIATVTDFLERYEFGQAARAIYDFLWDDYCDWYIELAKVRLKQGSPDEAAVVRATLVQVANDALKLLHPFMPFVTEELWQALPHEGESIMISPWPQVRPLSGDVDTQEVFGYLSSLVRTGRNLRAELNLPPSQKVRFVAFAESEKVLSDWRSLHREIYELLRAETIDWQVRHADMEKPKRAIAGVSPAGTLFLPLEGVVDIEREIARLSKALEGAQRDGEKLSRQLADVKFVERAPAEVVEKTRQNQQDTYTRIVQLQERLEDLQ